jgi:aconitate hydratase
VNIDILNNPIATTSNGEKVTLSMLWPTAAEIDEALARASRSSDFSPAYEEAEESRLWSDLEAPATILFPWNESSTYIRRPPFASFGHGSMLGEYNAHPLIVVGDDITTDHISPAGAIAASSEAGRYLIERGEDPRDLNVFASRRGNWEVMVRGLFTNRTVDNKLDSDIPPGFTIHAPSGDILPLWNAADRYGCEGESVVIVAGERYGMGSSRDWAAKGLALMGVRAVLALSFERIHRSNLIGMGILPLRLPSGLGPDQLILRSGDIICVDANPDKIAVRGRTPVIIRRRGGGTLPFEAHMAIETSIEIEILRLGGILPLILERSVKDARDGKIADDHK